MRLAFSLVAVAALATAAAAAPATPPRFETIDHGDTVEVIARGAIAAPAAAVGVVRERVEIPLANRAPELRRIVEDDPTAILVEVRGDAPRVLSIKLRRDHAGVVATAPAVRFAQEGDDLHVTIPRALPKPIVPIAATELPNPTPITGPSPNPNPNPNPSPNPNPIAKPNPNPSPNPIAAATVDAKPRALETADDKPTTAGTDAPAPTIAGASAPDATGGRWWLMLGGLALVGGGITLALRRKRAAAPIENQLEIIASRSLGGKNRVVWLAAGEREIVVAFSPQQIRPLAQWPRTAGKRAAAEPDAPADLELAPSRRTVERSFSRALDDAHADVAFAPRPAPAATPAARDDAPPARGSSPIPRLRNVTGTGASPAISGLLRLRDRTPTPAPHAVDLYDNDFDDDAQWARDVVTTRHGGRS